MTNANLSQNVDMGVEWLLRVSLQDCAAVRGALVGFYDKTDAAEMAVPGEGQRCQAEKVVVWIAGHLENKFSSCRKPPSFEERQRMEAFRRAFIGVGRRLDELAAKDPIYHTRAHNLLVMGAALVSSRAMLEEPGFQLKPEDYVKTMRRLTIACGHDLGHDGTNNERDGGYAPFLLEDESFAELKKIFEANGVSREDQDFMQNTLRATDFNLPGRIALAAYKKHNPASSCVAEGAETLEEELSALPPAQQERVRRFQKVLFENKELAEEAMLLKGCDMVPSYGLSERLWKKFCCDFHDESHAQTKKDVVGPDRLPIPKGQLYVMKEMVGKDAAGRAQFVHSVLDWLFGDHLRGLQTRCEADLAAVEATVINQKNQEPVRHNPSLKSGAVTPERR